MKSKIVFSSFGGGTVYADKEKCELIPADEKVIQKLFHHGGSAQKDYEQSEVREAIAIRANNLCGMPEFGWEWKL